jgi:UPF0716 protein FxsA
MRWFFLLLPWIELFTLIQLGSHIGAVPALLYVFVTFVLGLSIIRLQGMEIVNKLRAAENGQLLAGQLLGDELAMGFAGLLLLVPGLVTDTLALLVLFGPLRRRLFTALGGTPATAGAASPHRDFTRPGDPIEGEFRRIDDE